MARSVRTIGGRWSCARCYTVNPLGTQFCSDCGLAPRGGSTATMQSPASAARGRYLEVAPFVAFAVIAMGLLGLQLLH